MIKQFLTYIGFFVAGGLIVYLLSKLKKATANPETEKVSGKKFWEGLVAYFNPVLWMKDFVSLFNLRKLTIYFLIAGLVFSYAYIKGLGEKPVNVKLGWGREAFIEINENKDYLHIDKEGNVWIKNKKGEVLKQIKAKDMKGLQAQLAPIGLQFKPFILGGYGYGSSGGSLEGGVGVSFLRAWKANFDAFVTNKGIYGGVSYKLTDNSGVGLGVGKGWKKDEYRGIIYYKFEF